MSRIDKVLKKEIVGGVKFTNDTLTDDECVDVAVSTWSSKINEEVDGDVLKFIFVLTGMSNDEEMEELLFSVKDLLCVRYFTLKKLSELVLKDFMNFCEERENIKFLFF